MNILYRRARMYGTLMNLAAVILPVIIPGPIAILPGFMTFGDLFEDHDSLL